MVHIPVQVVPTVNPVHWERVNALPQVPRFLSKLPIPSHLISPVYRTHYFQFLLVSPIISSVSANLTAASRVYVIPLFAAYIADSYWGRYKTVCVSVGIALFGHTLLVVSAVPGVIEHSNGALACFIVAIIVMGLGTGGFKPNISPMVAEQYKKTKLFTRHTKSGEKVIVDPSLTTASIFMVTAHLPHFNESVNCPFQYFYLFVNVGALIGQIGMTYSEKVGFFFASDSKLYAPLLFFQYVGFWLAYTLPTVLFLLCPFVLFYGRNKYTLPPPTGSVLGSAIRAWRFAARDKWSWNPVKCYKQMSAPGFWDAAKPSKLPPAERPVWMTFDDVWIDELRSGLVACKVFLWSPIYCQSFCPVFGPMRSHLPRFCSGLTYNQITNNLTSQAATMATHGFPNDVLSNLDPLTLIIFIPICDLFVSPSESDIFASFSLTVSAQVYPGLRRLGINFTPLKRIALGFITGGLGMFWAVSILEPLTAPCGVKLTLLMV